MYCILYNDAQTLHIKSSTLSGGNSSRYKYSVPEQHRIKKKYEAESWLEGEAQADKDKS